MVLASASPTNGNKKRRSGPRGKRSLLLSSHTRAWTEPGVEGFILLRAPHPAWVVGFSL